MGEVWRGRHIDQEVEVAVKIMSQHSQDAGFQTAIRTEIRAAARLDHTGIIRVFDHGTVPASIAQHIGLPEGSPYLVMELARRGSLKERKVGDYRALRHILLALLDALAHAHARDVIHRDIKPSNVLFDGFGVLKLSDFGLAHAIDASHQRGLLSQHIAGTPQFMAPEQIEGRWRDEGPWTDLYALGCLAFLLVTGHCPYDGGDTQAILRSHLTEPVPKDPPRFALPDGFRAWLVRMMAKRPQHRFRRAADAAYALVELGDPSTPPGEGAGAEIDWKAYRTISASIGTDEGLSFIDLDSLDTEETLALDDALHRDGLSPSVSRVSMPESWRSEAPPPVAMDLVGAGLGLYGLRPVPMVGRQRERDRLWDALRDVWTTRSARLCVIRGEEGCGKSRLMDWMAGRAHELGLVRTLHAHHSPIPGRFESLPRMLATHLRCVGLTRSELRTRVRQLLEGQGLRTELDYECRALAELMMPGGEHRPFLGHGSASIQSSLASLREQAELPDEEDDQPLVRFSSPNERYVVIRRLFERIARDRPLLLCLDDVHWGLDALAFTRHILEHCEDLPVLVLMTVSREIAHELPDAAQQLEQLVSHRRAELIDLAPMNTAEHAQLVEHLLRLEPDVARMVQRRTAGNPLFAVQLVGDWVERGVLRVGPRGFQLADGERAVLPDDLHDIWRHRVERVAQSLEGDPEEARRALEIAAALGFEVDEQEWFSACERASIALPLEALVEELVEQGLASRLPMGWSFSHEMLRESLERTAVDHGRWVDHHLACVAMLEERSQEPGIQVRVGRHYLLARDVEGALPSLIAGAEEYLRHGDLNRARRVARMREDAMRRYTLSESDPRWGINWLQIARIHLESGRLSEAEPWVVEAERGASLHGWYDLLPRCSWMRGDLAFARGDYSQALTLYRAALTHYRATRDRMGEAEALHAIGRVYRAQERLEWAVENLKAAVAIFEDLSADLERGNALNELVAVCWGLKREDWASTCMHQALEAFEQASYPVGVARCLNNLGEAARARHDLATAQMRYQRALDTAAAAGDEHLELVIHVNLSMLFIQEGRDLDAERVLERALVDATRLDHHRLLAYIHTLLLCVELDDPLRWHSHYQTAIQHIAHLHLRDRDLAWAAHQASVRLIRRGDPRARHALSLALAQYHSQGEHERVAEIQRLLEEH